MPTPDDIFQLALEDILQDIRRWCYENRVLPVLPIVQSVETGTYSYLAPGGTSAEQVLNTLCVIAARVQGEITRTNLSGN